MSTSPIDDLLARTPGDVISSEGVAQLAQMIDNGIGEHVDVQTMDALRNTAVSLCRIVVDERGEHTRKMRHLEDRLEAQRSHIASLLADRQVKISRTRAWHEGREALLSQQAVGLRSQIKDIEIKLRLAEIRAERVEAYLVDSSPRGLWTPDQPPT